MSVTGREEFGRKRLHVITWGCQMNVYDSARMADVLAPLGYAPASVPDCADMVILNTCHIRDKAAEKVFSELGRLRRLKEKRAAEGERSLIECQVAQLGSLGVHRQQHVSLPILRYRPGNPDRG